MTPESQKLALLEWAGWRRVPVLCPICHLQHEMFSHDSAPSVNVCEPPNLSSLDVLATFEEKLEWVPDDEYCQASEYYQQLVFVCGNKADPPDVYEWHLITAKPAQRLEALVRTLGLWREEG